MTLLRSRLKEISAFIYILIFLLIFNLFFNLNYDWYGISLIVRIYLFVFSFYLIFCFASFKRDHLTEKYNKIYGKKGTIILFLEERVFPFFLIYLITILFTLIDYIRLPNWPWNPILSLFNGRYSNIIIYSLLLLLILKLKKEPKITIPLFLTVSILYFILDKVIYSASTSGVAISMIKIIKMMIFFYFLFYEFFNRISASIISSSILSCFVFLSLITYFSTIYKYSKDISYERREAGLLLIQFGFSSPLEGLKDLVINTSDFYLFQKLLLLSKKYNIAIDYTNEEWEDLLFSGPVSMTEFTSSYIINKKVDLSYERIIAFAEKRSSESNKQIENASNFIKISSRYLEGNEKDFFNRLETANKSFKLWGIAVLAEYRSIGSIPLLLKFITDVDANISKAAYIALKKITGLDPKETLNKRINDPDVIILFKEYYLLHHKDY